MTKKIGILGGTFNPIHHGHLAAAQEVHQRLKLDTILFIPSSLPPHKFDEDAPSAAHRMEMVRLATAADPAFQPSDIEIKRGGRSYTIDTIEELRSADPDAVYYFIMGMDSFLEIKTWNKWERLLSLCSFVVLSRPGYSFVELEKIDFMRQAARELSSLDRGELDQAQVRVGPFSIYLEKIPLHDISSTDIRARVKAGSSIKYLLPAQVEIYIIEHKLYV